MRNVMMTMAHLWDLHASPALFSQIAPAIPFRLVNRGIHAKI